MKRIQAHARTTAMIGDRMDTDIIAGIEGGLRTVQVLSGVTHKDDLTAYPFRPDVILNSVADLPSQI